MGVTNAIQPLAFSRHTPVREKNYPEVVPKQGQTIRHEIEKCDMAMMKALDRLVARYGPRPTTRLAKLLRDPEQAAELAGALEEAAARTPKGKPTPNARKSASVGMAVLKKLRLSDPEKHALIAEIRHQLMAGEVLSSMSQLRYFAQTHDLTVGNATSRNAAIAPFLRSLAKLPTHEILSMRDSMIKASNDDRSLERWREVIVRPRRP